MNTLPTTQDLKKQYKNIVAYAKFMGSQDWYLEVQLWKAHNADLPKDTVCISSTPNGDIVKTFADFAPSQIQGIKYYLNN